jgi:hypothetical protein
MWNLHTMLMSLALMVGLTSVTNLVLGRSGVKASQSDHVPMEWSAQRNVMRNWN